MPRHPLAPQRTLHRSALATLALLTPLVLAGCGSDGGDDDAAVTEGYPVTLENCGETVTVEQRPERIVSLNQGSTEILLSLGVADRMVGTATWTDDVLPDLAEANDTVERLADNAPSYERVLEVEPDLVTASFAPTLSEGGVASRQQFADLGVPTYVAQSECLKATVGNDDGTRDEPLTIDAIYDEVTQLGELVGEQDAAADLVDELQGRLDVAVAEGPQEPVRVMYWFANSEAPYLAGCCGGPGIADRLLGLENVFVSEQAEWPQVNWESIVEADPDVIVLGDLTRRSQTVETAEAKIDFLKNHPVASQLAAVTNDQFIEVPGGALNPSLRTIDLVEALSSGLTELGYE